MIFVLHFLWLQLSRDVWTGHICETMTFFQLWTGQSATGKLKIRFGLTIPFKIKTPRYVYCSGSQLKLFLLNSGVFFPLGSIQQCLLCTAGGLKPSRTVWKQGSVGPWGVLLHFLTSSWWFLHYFWPCPPHYPTLLFSKTPLLFYWSAVPASCQRSRRPCLQAEVEADR